MREFLTDREPAEPEEQVEALIRAAGRYVRPSEDLRPRTLEAARQECDDRRAEQKLGGFVIAVLLALLIASPTVTYGPALRVKAYSAGDDIEVQARNFSSRPEIGSHWGLAEAFSKLRAIQADRLSGFRSMRLPSD